MHKWLYVGGALVVVLLVGAWLALRFYVQFVIEVKVASQLTPAQQVRLHRFFTEPVEIPAEWQEVKPYPAELIQPVSDLANLVAHSEQAAPDQWMDKDPIRALFARMRDRKELSAGEWQQVETAVARWRPAIAKYAELVTDPEYDLSLCHAADGTPRPYWEMQQLNKQLNLQAYVEVHDGHCDTAFADLATALEGNCRHPASSPTDRTLTVSWTGIAAYSLADLADQCRDPNLLRQALTLTEQLKPLLFPEGMEEQDPYMLDIVTVLREAKQKGATVDLSSGHPLAYYQRQELLWWIQQVHQEHPEPSIESERKLLEGGERLRLLGLFTSFQKLVFSAEVPAYDELFPPNKLRNGRAEYELMQAHLAARLKQLETGQPSTSTKELVPAYLAAEPMDPFVAQPLLWDASAQEFYSVGPDKADDHDRLTYDPTNGINSSGDISLR